MNSHTSLIFRNKSDLQIKSVSGALPSLAVPSRLHLAVHTAPVAVVEREPVIAGLVALHRPVAAVGQSRCFGAVALVLGITQDSAHPSGFHLARTAAPVAIDVVAVVADLAVLSFHFAVAAQHFESLVVQVDAHSVVDADPAELHLAETAAAVAVGSVAVLADFPFVGFEQSVAAVADDDFGSAD